MTCHTYTPGQRIHNYKVVAVTPLPIIDSTLIQLVHDKTRARHFHIANQDKENTFSVIFRTVPTDSTGVAHILEHTVLCGSRHFNVRDPFFSMIKRSLSTFMNAFTASDWTMYPFATQNEKDYFNLMDVYLDAAFFPKIDELSFKQEGSRLDIDPSQNPELVYKGVVYNEMKGAMSSPSQVMGRALLQSLYPDTTYSNNSGGDPLEIPKLTWQDLKRFHSRYYHPSNAQFYTYGNLPLEKTLAFIHDKVLHGFDFLSVDSSVPAQPRWQTPRQETYTYAYSDTDTMDKKYQGCVAWLTCDAKDAFEVLVLTVLEQILIGNAASPLRKALIDSNLGSALADASGFEPDNRDAMFAIGLKDIEKSAVAQVESIVFSTLEKLVKEGIAPDLVESAIHQIEFYRKEITNTPYPFGIKLLLSFTGNLIHDGDPVSCINIDADLERLQQALAKGGFLEERLKTYFIDNPHRVLFTLAPDPDLESTTENQIKKELTKIYQNLSQQDLEKIKQDATQLEQIQEQQEDLSVLPTLELTDVPPEIEMISPDQLDRVTHAAGYDKATSGILYFTCPMGAGHVATSLFPLVPFFCQAFTHSGTARQSYIRMAEKIDRYTGGVTLSPFSGTYFDKEADSHVFLALQGKALDRNVPHLFDIVKEFVLTYGFTDLERLKNLLLQYQAGMESSIVATGHRYAISLSSRHLSMASHINEIWHGIAQYQTIKQIVQNITDPETAQPVMEQLAENLNTMAGGILRKDNFKPAVIGSLDAIQQADQAIGQMLVALPDGSRPAFFTPDIPRDTQAPRDGWMTNTAVSFVGQSFKTVGITHEDAPGLSVISKILRALFLHREIREKGGAYGGFAIYNSEEGIFSLGSYRDPHITRTLDVYQKACEYIMKGDYTQTDVKEAILQVCSDIDKPETPGPAAMKAFYRDIARLTDEIRRQFKDQLLQLDKNRVQAIAQKYFDLDGRQAGVSVISSKTALEQANLTLEKSGQTPLVLNKI
ncbi:insulinase family protein [Desulfotignum phosphitoxidans]|jgi:Zn-dependent M16 (insulinase) family peptidase|uniref:Hydrogenase nickel incorporation protein HypA n=2 Tax=Desulfotignum TaxID=115780 RepID=S0G1Q6_9BACT|nr:insulinase family protein [Desulfotignum phosphitoxidans]EMS78102.1 hydrogenase nickel incorporation protein HypA [Desulfotignum phosphitoxidans DSM 13687]